MSQEEKKIKRGGNGIEELKRDLFERLDIMVGSQIAELKRELFEIKGRLPKEATPQDHGHMNMRSLFAPVKNDQAELTKKLLTSDEDNYTKARTPSPFAMTIFDLFGPWITGKTKSMNDFLSPKMAQPHEISFSNMYRINSISFRGQSRDEYVSVMQPIGLNADMLQFKMSEKQKLKEGARK